MFRSASLFIGTSFIVAVFTILATSNVDSIVGIPHKIYSMQRILIHIISRSLCIMCLSAPRVCSEPGGQTPVLSLSLDLIHKRLEVVTRVVTVKYIFPILVPFLCSGLCCRILWWGALRCKTMSNNLCWDNPPWHNFNHATPISISGHSRFSQI